MPTMLQIAIRKTKSLVNLNLRFPLLSGESQIQVEKDYYRYYSAIAPPESKFHLIHPWIIQPSVGPNRQLASGSLIQLCDDEAMRRWSVGRHYVFFQVLVDHYTEYMGKGPVDIRESTVAIPISMAPLARQKYYPQNDLLPPVRYWNYWESCHPHRDEMVKWREGFGRGQLIMDWSNLIFT